ncbi:hypothetical protein L6164_028907 [Bauhinia variegata]|uniref:Uncharacterized protein n=1 Tax=Bauhinia variegata TaxID=167791 RepID=A0ACB9L839_BAUVA|nr:hypothetical protein L6164_028907 [Bauhinia variegata]
MKKADLVFVPSPGMGHLVSTVEFSNLLLQRDEELSIIVLVMEEGKEHIPRLATHANICFIELPHVELPPDELMIKCIEKYRAEAVEAHKDCVKEAIVKKVLPNSPKLLGLVVDLFCSSMIDVANELGLPSYLFFTSGVSFLGFTLYLSYRFDRVGREFEESDPESIVPGYINPVPANVMPNFAFNIDGYISFANHGRKFRETKGIVVNSFLDLESHAVSSLSTHDLPPIYTVGPLINHKNENTMQSNNQSQHDEIMRWLDEQPPSSVVFLCFGSRGYFGVPQLKETALGLERSGHRFLWSIRIASKGKSPRPNEDIDPKTILPEGFLDRTKGRGYVCGWAPQVEVLAHKAVGGFVSHCGWNSILESLWFGVPILTWPLYAEQQINAFQLVKDLGLAFELRLDSRRFSDEIVKSDEIANAVKCLMEEDSEVRKRVKDISVKSRKAMIAGGNSYASVGQWVEAMLASN